MRQLLAVVAKSTQIEAGLDNNIIHVTIYTKAPIPCSIVRAHRNLTSLYTDQSRRPKIRHKIY